MKLKMRKGQRHKQAALVGCLEGRAAPRRVAGPLWTGFLEHSEQPPSGPLSSFLEQRGLTEAAPHPRDRWDLGRATNSAPIYQSLEIVWLTFCHYCHCCFSG